MRKLLSFFVVLIATCALWAGNTITYSELEACGEYEFSNRSCLATYLTTTTITDMTCAQASAAALALQSGETGTDTVSIVGFVTNTNGTVSRGQQTFWLDDQPGTTRTFQAYWCNLPIDDQTPLNVGDKVKIVGFLMNYSGTTAEMKNGAVTILERWVPDTTEVSICDAIENGEALNAGDESDDYFIVRGVVSAANAYNGTYNNQTFDFKCADNNKVLEAYNVSIADTVAVGDTVEVLGRLYNYRDTKIEFKGGQATIVGKAKVLCNITTSSASGGTTRGDTIAITGSQVTLTAIPDDNYHFKIWSDGCTENPRNITVGYTDKEYVAIFEENPTCGANVHWWFNTSAGVLSISGSGAMDDYSLIEYAPWKEYVSSILAIEISEGVTRIGNAAFYNCSGLTSVTIPNSITSIGDYAFYGCNSLNSPIYTNTIFAYMPTSYSGEYTIPQGIQTIGYGAFRGCFGLTSITIPNSVTSIGEGAFCFSGLTSIIIPNSVMSIGRSAFSGCSELTSITIPNSVTSIGNNAFADCSALATVIIPDSVTLIGYGVFCGCSSLTSVTIPNNVSSIGEDAFRGCSGLTTITIPNSVTSFGDNAFYGCSSLNSVLVDACMPPSVGSAAFGYANLSEIIVPNGSIANYQTAAIWRNYIDIIREKYSFVAVPADDQMGQIEVEHDCGSALLRVIPNYGYHFTQWSDGNTENPRTIAITQDTALIAEFTPNQCAVIVSSGNMQQGTVTGSVFAHYMDETVISATPTEGYHFTQWSDGNTENPRTIVVTQDTAFVASFAINQYLLTLSVNDENMGVVTGGGLYEHKSMVEVKATPVSGFEFVKWSDGSTYNPYTFIIREDMSLQAEFREIQSGIESTEATPNVQKIFREGHLYILRDGQVYDATGRRVE